MVYITRRKNKASQAIVARRFCKNKTKNMIKKTINESQFIDELLSDEYAGWTYNGAEALFDYLDNLSEEIGQDIELDRVALRCDYSEYKSAWDAMEQYQPEDMPVEGEEGDDLIEIQEKNEAAALEWLQDRTTVITFDGGVIIQQF